MTQFSLRPVRGCESTNNRGSDRKTEKCQNSISKQTMSIVTLFKVNKKVISLDYKFRGLTRPFLYLRKSRNSWTKAVAHPRGDPTLLFITKKFDSQIFGDLTSFFIFGKILQKREAKKGNETKSRIESPIDVSRCSTITLNSR